MPFPLHNPLFHSRGRKPADPKLADPRNILKLAAIALSILSTLTLTAGQRDHGGNVRVVRSANAGLIQSPDANNALPSSAQLLRALRPQRSHYYQIYTNLPPDQAQPYATHMDQVFAAYERRFNAFEERSSGPMPLYLFRSRQDYQAFLRLQQIDGENSGGMFFVCPTGRGLATFVGEQPRSKVFATLQHEGFHQFADKYIGPNLPIWINEGLAQYFEAGLMVQGKLKLGTPDPFWLDMIRQALEENRTLPFADMLALTPEKWRAIVAQDVTQARVLYAQAWSMVYFLIHAKDARFRPLVNEYLVLISQNTDPTDAFNQAFGDDLQSFERQWRQYIKEVQPDPLNNAVEHLTFLAQALAYLKDNNQPTPTSLDQLRQTLTRLRFRATWQVESVTREYAAWDANLYTYPTSGGGGSSADFTLLEPERADLPPRLSAPGLKPEPTLTWSRTPQGDLHFEIEYR